MSKFMRKHIIMIVCVCFHYSFRNSIQRLRAITSRSKLIAVWWMYMDRWKMDVVGWPEWLPGVSVVPWGKSNLPSIYLLGFYPVLNIIVIKYYISNDNIIPHLWPLTMPQSQILVCKRYVQCFPKDDLVIHNILISSILKSKYFFLKLKHKL